MTKKSSTVLNVYKNKAFRIVLIYLLISLLWIYFSDKFVEAIDFPESTKTIISMIKGWAFVIVSSYILYILIKNALKQKDSNEERLSDLELRHQQLFQTSMDGIIYTEPNGNIYAVNDEACRILGSTREEIIFAGRDSIVDNSDPRLIQALNERKEKGYFFGELNFKRKNGEIFPAELTSTIVKSKDGKELAYIIFRDISDKKKIEHEIITAKEKGIGPEEVSEKVFDAITAVKPRTRYLVTENQLQYRFIQLLKLFSDSVLDSIIMKKM